MIQVRSSTNGETTELGVDEQFDNEEIGLSPHDLADEPTTKMT